MPAKGGEEGDRRQETEVRIKEKGGGSISLNIKALGID